MTLTLKYWWW